MNLFATDTCPVKSAQALDDKRVGKLLMEANQMMSLAIKEWDPQNLLGWETGPGKLTEGYAHRNHPVSVWVRTNFMTFQWTFDHADALADEFEYRFGKPHASAERTPYIYSFENVLPLGPLPEFHNSARNIGIGVDYTWMPEPVIAYRFYLANRWKNDKMPVKFTNRGEPSWLKSLE